MNNKLFNAIKALPLKKSPLNSEGGETNGESNFTIDFITISKAFRPYCNQEGYESVTGKPGQRGRLHLFTHLVVKVKPAEISGFCCSPVSVGESTLSQKCISVIFNIPQKRLEKTDLSDRYQAF